MNLQEIKELLKIINETDISELNWESDGVKINIKKANGASGGTGEKTFIPQPLPDSSPPEPALSRLNQLEADPNSAGHQLEISAEGLVPIVAPMVGIFYAAPAPDAAPFVKLGEKVKEGQTVCIIEAMKLMNEIDAEVAGEVVDILVNNGDPVEYGQTLFLIKAENRGK